MAFRRRFFAVFLSEFSIKQLFKTLDVFLSECFARRVIFIRAAGAVRTWADVYNVGVAGVVFRMVGAVLYIALDMIDALFKFGGCGVLT